MVLVSNLTNKIKDVKPEYVYIDYLELVKGEDILKALRKLCDEIEIAVLVVSMTASKSDSSEYKSDKYEEVNNFMIITDESIISMD